MDDDSDNGSFGGGLGSETCTSAKLTSTAATQGSRRRDSDLDGVLTVFKTYDGDNSGALDREELKHVLQMLDPVLWTDAKVDKLMKTADRNCDGQIQFEEFLAWLFAVDDKKRRSIGATIPDPLTSLNSDSFSATVNLGGSQALPSTPFVGEQKSRSRCLDDFYDVGGRLAEGSIGTVYRATNKATGVELAIKTVTKDELSKMRRQGPFAQFASVDMSLHNIAADGYSFLGQVEVADARVARVKIECEIENASRDDDKDMSVSIRAKLRRDDDLLHTVDVFTLLAKPGLDEGSSCKNSRTFPVRDGFAYSARRGDVYEFECQVKVLRRDAKSENDDEERWRVLSCELILTNFQAKLFSNLQATEVAISMSLDHPNIVKMLDMFEDFRHLHFVMELSEGGELFDAVLERGGFFDHEATKLARQAFSGIVHMHSRDVMHRDLSLENLMLLEPLSKCPIERNVLKIGGLGLSRPLPKPGTFCSTRVGSAYYLAPEVLDLEYDQGCDVWSLGVVCFILLTGRPPFDSETEIGIWQNVQLGYFAFEPEEKEKTTDLARKFVCKCLTISRTSRWTATDALAHAWLEYSQRLSMGGFAAPEEVAADAVRPVRPALVPAMRNFWRSSLIQKAACSFVAQMDPAKLAEVRDIFELLDADHSGELTVSELRMGLETAGLGLGVGTEGWRKWLEKTFGSEDDPATNCKTICYTTFLASALDQRTFEEEDVCWAAFRGFDRDGSGSISAAELDEALRSLGEDTLAMGAESIEELRRQADLNKDGNIDFYEFVNAVRSTNQRRTSELDVSWGMSIKGFDKSDLGACSTCRSGRPSERA
mmetsp:Transcript_52710/g.171398  ORF Transcript_52710/g.171398 Transcript_52710/m.171398 type:complete len:825 (-) Transcript_52710:334-2808(-)